ncbi:HAMP domain-containing sensor histidine kinase [Paenibacillus sp. 1001270B_150601_E10]|uniref:HAMP domain-containing sensor histidine kinase n=1 Tax=Paenibacillus sp. 1001270B_150601_E10 TaxID=2787079 RepID=UPI00189CE399|nr:HAMP domain-containing sensor histidine kinase [Paenibacillus sp. 1001270B_150601_E10]
MGIKRKALSLKTTLVLYVLAGIVVAIFLNTIVSRILVDNIQYAIQDYRITPDAEGRTSIQLQPSSSSEGNQSQKNALVVTADPSSRWVLLNSLLSVGIVAGIALISALLFYRFRLKRPMQLLNDGVERVMSHDLDFKLSYAIDDELGKLCGAFESMRCELNDHFHRQWREQEERKQFLQSVAHDLRTPVTIIRGHLDVLKKKVMHTNTYPTQEKLADSLQLITEYTSRIGTYLDRLQHLQSMEEWPVEFTKVRERMLVDKVQKVTALLAEPYRKQVHVMWDSRLNVEEEREALFDEPLFMQVLENVVNNAIRYAKRVITVQIQWGHDRLVCSVADDGKGFSKEELQHACEPFFRDQGFFSEGHFGLGLAISRTLVTRHNGKIELCNAESGGAIVRFKISIQ